MILLYAKSEMLIDSFLLYPEIQLWSTQELLWLSGRPLMKMIGIHINTNTQITSRGRQPLNSCQFASYTPEIYWICKAGKKREKNTQEEKTQQGLKSIRRLEWAVNTKCEWGKSFPQLSLTPYNIAGKSPALSRGLRQLAGDSASYISSDDKLALVQHFTPAALIH